MTESYTNRVMKKDKTGIAMGCNEAYSYLDRMNELASKKKMRRIQV
jgi:hypothetical protein